MPLDIPANDHGKIYVFDVPEADATRPVAELLGLDEVNREYVDMVTLADLPSTGGLVWYLKEGYGLTASPEETLAFAAIPTHALLVMSRAFDGTAQSLAPMVRHATTLDAPPPKATVPLTGGAGTEGTLEGGVVPAKPEYSSRIWVYALVVIFAIFAFMAWRIASGNV